MFQSKRKHKENNSVKDTFFRSYSHSLITYLLCAKCWGDHLRTLPLPLEGPDWEGR